MKLPCEIVQDLLPLLEDGVCSEQSRSAVTEHLKQCENCRKLAENTRCLPELALQPEPRAEDKAVVKSFRKVRRYWLLSLLAVVLIVSVILLGYLSRRGNYLADSEEVITAGAFTNALASGDFEKAAGFLDYSNTYEYMQQQLALPPESYGPQLTEVQIGDELWIANTGFAERYLTDTSDALRTWFDLAQNGLPGILLPETVWDELIRTDPGAFTKDSDGTEVFDGTRYYRYETDWGVFMLNESMREDMAKDSLENLIWEGYIDLFPAEIYQDLKLKQQFDEKALSDYQNIQFVFADAAGKSLEEYTEYERNEYADGLDNLALQSLRVKNKGYQSAYPTPDGRFFVIYAVEVSWKESSGVIYLDIACRDGSVIAVSPHHDTAAYWVYLFENAVSMG